MTAAAPKHKTNLRQCAASLARALPVATLLLQGCSLMEQASLPSFPTRPAPPIESETPAATPIDIRAAQQGLAELGYYDSGIDGVIGPKTKAAVSAFQKDKQLQVTGDLSPDLVQTIVKSAAGRRQKLAAFKGISQPVYETGDRFFYSDGSYETVLSVETDRVVWESSDGTRRSAPWNFLLPPFAWWSEHGTGSADADINKDILWPLKPGDEVRFSTTATMMESSPHPEEIFELWHCRVRSISRLTVPAGSFETVPVACTVFRQPAGPKRTVTWHYAPEIGHFIRRTEGMPGNTEGRAKENVIDLVAVELGGHEWPDAARAGLDWAFQHALENESAGKSVEWESSALPGRIEIEPLAEVDYAEVGPCRRFAETRIDAEGMKRIYPGIACRTADGSWSIPSGAEQASAELPQ